MYLKRIRYRVTFLPARFLLLVSSCQAASYKPIQTRVYKRAYSRDNCTETISRRGVRIWSYTS